MNVAATLDQKTATAIQSAVTAASRGQLTEACAIGERALADGCDGVALNALLGMFRCQAGDFGLGIGHLRVAHEQRPEDPKIFTNLIAALTSDGREREAFELLASSKVHNDPDLKLERQRAFLAQQLSEHQAAADAYGRVVARFPDDWEAWNNLGNTRRMLGDFSGSMEALQRAEDLEPHSAPVRLNLALAIAATGDLAEAERHLRTLVADRPQDLQPILELRALLREQAREEEALAVIEQAVARMPTSIPLLLDLASHQLLLQQYQAGEATYKTVIGLAPANTAANVGLALVYELTNQSERLSQLVDEAARREVEPAALNFILALDHRRAKRFNEGLEALSRVPEELETPRRAHLEGQLLEGAGRYDDAFRSYSKMNALAADEPSNPARRGSGYRNSIRQQHALVTPEWVASWRAEDDRDPRPNPAFLVGFPRSGTTLLDTMLMGHPDIEVLEEEPALREASFVLKDFASLATAGDDLIKMARDTYFRSAASFTPLAPGKLLVDKNPLTMNQLPLVRRLFPDARIILAVRHPCDVVLSCFVTNFRANDGMASFLSLETAAELYDLSFSYFERCRELLDMPTHTVIYERVVADREAELAALIDFLGVDWHDDMLDHQTTALGRGRIKTASYSQVTEPIYTRSAGRWERYREHLEPVLPVLRPWIDKFGYSA